MSAITQSVPRKAIQDGEWDRTSSQEKGYFVINGLGAGKSAAFIAQGATSAAAVAGSIIPGLQIAQGLGYVVSGAVDVVPNAWKELQNIKPKDAEGRTIAKLGLANAVLYEGVGLGQISCGTVSAVGLLSDANTTVAAQASGIALGVIYAIRGGVVIARAEKNLRCIEKFENEFRENCTDVNKAIRWINRQKQSTKNNRFGRIVGQIKLKNNWYSNNDRVDYLKEVDKAIYTKKLQYKWSRCIGVTMLLAGISLILLACFCPYVALIIGLCASSFSLAMEGLFLPYDWSPWFYKIRDWLYTTPDYITKLSVIPDDWVLVDAPQKKQVKFSS